MKSEAEKIIAENAEWLGPFDLEQCLYTVNEDTLVVFHPLTSPTTWMVHIAAKRGNGAHRVFRGLMAADRWFRDRMPDVKKLVGFIREDNFRALKASSFMGFKPEGHISDYVVQDGKFYGIIVMGRRQ